MTTKLHIFHTNDLHSHFDYLLDQKQWILQQKQYYEQKGDTVLIIDLGDFADRVHPMIEASDSQFATDLLNDMQVDLITIGNNEGLGNSHEQLERLYQHKRFEVCLANLIDARTGNAPVFAMRFVIRRIGNCRIAFIGLTAPFPESYEPNDWIVEHFDEVLPSLLAELEGQCDEIVLLSHLGIHADRLIAQKYSQIRLILGAHTHHVFPAGEWENNTLLTGGGKYGQYVGHLQLTIEATSIVERTEQLFDLHAGALSQASAQFANDIYNRGNMALKSNLVANIPKKMKKNWLMDNDLVQLGLDAMMDYAQTNIAFLEAGLFLTDLSSGALTKYELHQCLPHPMHLNRCTMLGSHFIELIKSMEQQMDELRELELRGRGFRGEIFGQLVYKGVQFDRASGIVILNQQPIEEHQWITFVCVDHLRFLPYFREIENFGQNEILYPHFLRDVLAIYIQKGKESGTV